MKLWGGRFTKETDAAVNAFNASLPFDRRLYEQDIRGSIAHVTMLAAQGILTHDEKKDKAVRKGHYQKAGIFLFLYLALNLLRLVLQGRIGS